VLAAHPAQAARLLEAEAAVQCDRGIAAGVGDDRDDLPGADPVSSAPSRARPSPRPVRAGETYTVSSTVCR
jgi:hypothetical protein